MFSIQKFRTAIFCLAVIGTWHGLPIQALAQVLPHTANGPPLQKVAEAPDRPSIRDADGKPNLDTAINVSKTISLKALEKYETIKITVSQDGKDVTYTGVPLRTLFGEMVPDIKLDSMKEWKSLSRKELVMEIKGDDGFPALVTATDLVINKSGDRFVLATHKDEKSIEDGAHLICKMDEAHIRWIRQVVSLRVASVPKTP